MLALGTPDHNLERYLDFLQYLKVIAAEEANLNFEIEVVNAVKPSKSSSSEFSLVCERD